MSSVDVDAVLEGLRPFQRDAVAHVTEQFFGHGHETRSGRFLIADETGLGKSVIARGVIARTIQELEADETVDRIDVVYICSNSDLASQNLKRLNVTGQNKIAMATRLSLLAKESARLNQGVGDPKRNSKPINLVSFTPGTSFSPAAWRQGSGEERALVVLLLDEILQQPAVERHITRVMFQGTVGSVERFSSRYVDQLSQSLPDGVDRNIREKFEQAARTSGAIAEFLRLQALMVGDTIPPEIWNEVQEIMARMRRFLARASVDTLEPDLIILDEFQRFKALLDPSTGSEASELADALFSYPNAKVLLLSATPYKPYTQAHDDDENHYEDFLATASFLCGHDASRVRAVQAALSAYRRSLVSGDGTQSAADRVRAELVPLMTRSERPNTVADRELVKVRRIEVSAPAPSALKRWVALSELGISLGSPISIDYWKSIPYFANFMENYRLAGQLIKHAVGPQAASLAQKLRSTDSLTRDFVERRAKIDVGNGPLRALMNETLDRGWWKLLWMPPSMPYLKPGRVYEPFSDGTPTKQVLFSSWSAAPKAIATIMSHEAERRMAGIGPMGIDRDEIQSPSQRLTYRQADEHAASLSTLALFWPHPGLLAHADQLNAVRANRELLGAEQFAADIRARLMRGQEADRAWQAFFAYPGAFDPATSDEAYAVSGLSHGAGTDGLRANLETAKEYAEVHQSDPLYHPDVARIVAFAPGSVAFRAVSSLAGEHCTARGIWRAAFIIADGLRTLFNRPDSQDLLDQLGHLGLLGRETESRSPYWSRVLDYCADGNLRAVLDEYLFQLWCETGRAVVTDQLLLDIAEVAFGALGLRPARYIAHEANLERTQLPMMTRFAVPYGGSEGSGGESGSAVARQGTVRAAFNSPFAPFVLTSTSVGQEGIDFHWWSHAVVHWNLPSNPVDFEQREGRVNRYGGHAVRKNVAQAHWCDVLASTDPNAWSAAFDAASQEETDAGEFSPWWVYEGPAQIQRVLVQYPMSRDIERYERLRSALTLYRLTLGQPRQEDMVEMLERRNVDARDVPMIDLRPPSRDKAESV